MDYDDYEVEYDDKHLKDLMVVQPLSSKFEEGGKFSEEHFFGKLFIDALKRNEGELGDDSPEFTLFREYPMSEERRIRCYMALEYAGVCKFICSRTLAVPIACCVLISEHYDESSGGWLGRYKKALIDMEFFEAIRKEVLSNPSETLIDFFRYAPFAVRYFLGPDSIATWKYDHEGYYC